MDLSGLKRDTATIESGEWVGDIKDMGGLRLKVRGLSCKLYQATFARYTRAIPKSDRERDGSPSPEALILAMARAAGETILLDWDGISDGDQPVPYDAARAKAMLVDPDYRPFLDAVITAAQIVDNNRAAAVEDLTKNSPAPSAGQ